MGWCAGWMVLTQVTLIVVQLSPRKCPHLAVRTGGAGVRLPSLSCQLPSVLAVEGPGTGRIWSKQLCLWGVHCQSLPRHSPSLRVIFHFFSAAQFLEMREGGRWWLVRQDLSEVLLLGS